MDKAEQFVKALDNYLVDYSLTSTDKKMIKNLFNTYNQKQIVKEIIYADRGPFKLKFLSKDAIRSFVADKTNLPDFDKNPTRKREYVKARQFYCFVLYIFGNLGVVEMSTLMASQKRKSGHLDHTTISAAIKKGKKLIQTNLIYSSIYQQFKKEFDIKHVNKRKIQ